MDNITPMIAIVGCNGQLGKDLVLSCHKYDREIVALDIPDIDITRYRSIEKTLGAHRISMVINSAAYTAVDAAESESELAFAVNRDGSANLAMFCSNRNIPLLHISTDYVFRGDKTSAYLEDDPISPIGVYGASKAAGEKEIIRLLDKHIIIRTAWLYGNHGQNFVKTMLRLANEHETLRVVNDQYGCPTFAADLAEAILTLTNQIDSGRPYWGTFHFCGQGATTWFDFANAIFDIAGRYMSLTVEQVLPVTTAEYPTPAQRPRYSILDCSKIKKCYNIHPRPWQQSLAEMIKNLQIPH